MEKKKVDTVIIMCIWKRLERLDHTLKMLNKQKDKSFNVFFWNNNVNIKDDVDKIIDKYSGDINIKVKHNNKNIGGIGRFYAAKEVASDYEKVIFIDDDQNFNDEMVQMFNSEYVANTVKSRWSFIMNNTYMNRKRIQTSNVDVNYCGTGGMILPISVFKNNELFNIPEKYWWIEDLWLSYFCSHILNMKLKSIGEPNKYINQINDGKDQSTADKIKTKNEFYQFLKNKKGWKK